MADITTKVPDQEHITTKTFMDMQITDKPTVIEIYNSKGGTRMLADRYSYKLSIKIRTRTISEIKNGTGFYEPIIKEYKFEMARFLFRRQYGYDPIKKYYPPPFGKIDSKETVNLFRRQNIFKKSA